MLYVTMIICTLAVTGAALYDHFKPVENIEKKHRIKISDDVDKDIISKEQINKYHKDVRQFVIDTYEILEEEGVENVKLNPNSDQNYMITEKISYWFWNNNEWWELYEPMNIKLNKKEIKLLRPMVNKIKSHFKSIKEQKIKDLEFKKSNLKLK